MRREVPAEAAIPRQDLRRLTERLLCEYAGAVPAGRVARAVADASRMMQRRGMRGQSLVLMAEQVARRGLTDEIARTSIEPLPVEVTDDVGPAVDVGRLPLATRDAAGRLAS